jgi:hypothetical protein
MALYQNELIDRSLFATLMRIGRYLKIDHSKEEVDAVTE